MKKLVALVLMVAALLGVAVTARATVGYKYITNYEEIQGVVWDNRHAATEIKAGVAYNSSTKQGINVYFKFCPSETQTYNR